MLSVSALSYFKKSPPRRIIARVQGKQDTDLNFVEVVRDRLNIVELGALEWLSH
jgi:hypothetical protein